ncbi:alanine dehydrogenase [Christensenellaceae bacterium OttesenSCG-928-K19]|nr:alanine dehydrogenase [Christensenellaceae bacterium OttesenSCG-928-K19]
MKIGTVKELKQHEYRVGLTPNSAREYVKRGHEVYVQAGAGTGSGFTDEMYMKEGCSILEKAADVYSLVDMIVKVKEPLEPELKLIREGQVLFTYLHLAADRQLTQALMDTGCIGVAYETIVGPDGELPCLKPMSQIAGRLSIQEGAKYLEKPFGGRGVLLSGVPGVSKAKVAIIGAGIVGINAAKIATGIGAQVTILDIDLNRLEYVEDVFGNTINTMYSTPGNVKRALHEADLVVGAVLRPGAAAPKIIKKSYLGNMKEGSVIVDVAIDQGGCTEVSHPTYHDDPVYVVDGVVFYCVGNMPGAVSNTSTNALNNATLPYGLAIAEKGIAAAMKEDEGLLMGLNLYHGKLTCQGVADSFGMECTNPAQAVE